ncbi:HEPN domain-containing protein [Pandoraea pneumonica]
MKLSSNFLELERKLSTLGWPTPGLSKYAKHVGASWFRLAEEHLDEAKKIRKSGCSRACFSRAYYAAYNASKSVRYMVQGNVSLKGDDHSKASSDLPRDFPDVGSWASRVGKLYEHRLRADYDNWGSTTSENTMRPSEAIADAEAFLVAAKDYLNKKCGMTL